MYYLQGLDPNALDFMVCNAGALIWHSTAPQSNPEAVNSADTTRLLCDDEWEHYIDWRWDDRVVKQVRSRQLHAQSSMLLRLFALVCKGGYVHGFKFLLSQLAL